MKPLDMFKPFSNGFEYEMWLSHNCRRGPRGCRNYNPEASTSRNGCPMEVAIALAAGSDGQVKAKQGLRAGLLEPGPRGELVIADGDPSTWLCPEYKGYDEPDDRPRRGPRPPAEQMDLLDPRNDLLVRRGGADDGQAQTPLPASVSATPEGSQRGRSEA